MLEDKGNICTGNAIVYSRLVQNHDISEEGELWIDCRKAQYIIYVKIYYTVDLY